MSEEQKELNRRRRDDDRALAEQIVPGGPLRCSEATLCAKYNVSPWLVQCPDAARVALLAAIEQRHEGLV